jgi:glycosyltransferase involved in cell wall biosynthesis
MRILLRAPLLSISGYGIHSRQVFQWLETLEGVDLVVDIVKWGMTAWNICGESENGLIKRIMSKSKPVDKEKFDYSFQVQLPDEWDTNLADINIGVTALVETDRCSPKWVDCCNRMDAIIVPSKFTKNVIKRSGSINHTWPKSVYVIPEWFNENITNKNKEKIKISLSSKFNFLLIGTITSRNAEDDRKNIFYTIKWICEEFKDEKRVGLVIKTSFGKGSQIDRQLTKQCIEQVISEVRVGKFPKINLIHGNMDSEEIASLYSVPKISCFVSATKGEGYGLPLIEAAASGMPVVATGWSGHTDFLKSGKYLSVDYNLEQIKESKVDDRVFVKGTRWADVSESSFKRKIRDAYKNHVKHKKNAVELQSYVTREFCKDAVIKTYNDFFEDIKDNKVKI